MSMIALAAALLLSGQTTPPEQRSASDLTRDLNSLPPSAASRPAPRPPAPTPAAETPSAGAAATRDLNSAPPAAVAPVPAATPAPAPEVPASSSAPVSRPAPSLAPHPDPGPAAPAPTAAPAPQPRPTPAPTPVATAPAASAPATSPPAPAAPRGLDAAALATLPFTVETPAGFSMVRLPAGPDASVYGVKRGDQTFVMIYAGPSSQFPIYDGQMVQAGGRASVVVTEEGRRLALEHLFQRATAPREVHVWVASVDGADRRIAEQIAQSVDVR